MKLGSNLINSKPAKEFYVVERIINSDIDYLAKFECDIDRIQLEYGTLKNAMPLDQVTAKKCIDGCKLLWDFVMKNDTRNNVKYNIKKVTSFVR